MQATDAPVKKQEKIATILRKKTKANNARFDRSGSQILERNSVYFVWCIFRAKRLREKLTAPAKADYIKGGRGGGIIGKHPQRGAGLSTGYPQGGGMSGGRGGGAGGRRGGIGRRGMRSGRRCWRSPGGNRSGGVRCLRVRRRGNAGRGPVARGTSRARASRSTRIACTGRGRRGRSGGRGEVAGRRSGGVRHIRQCSRCFPGHPAVFPGVLPVLSGISPRDVPAFSGLSCQLSGHSPGVPGRPAAIPECDLSGKGHSQPSSGRPGVPVGVSPCPRHHRGQSGQYPIGVFPQFPIVQGGEYGIWKLGHLPVKYGEINPPFLHILQFPPMRRKYNFAIFQIPSCIRSRSHPCCLDGHHARKVGKWGIHFCLPSCFPM